MKVGAITFTPKTLTLYGKGKTSAAKVVVAEKNYNGSFTQTNTCKNIASLTPTKGKGPSFTVTLEAIRKGSCTVTYSDSNGRKGTLSVADKAGGGRLLTSMLVPIAGPRAKRGRDYVRPKFISPSTQAMTVVIENPSSGITYVNSVSGLTALTPGCTLTLQGLDCTFGASLPACTDGTNCYTAMFTTYDAYVQSANTIPAGAAPLSISKSTFTIANGETNDVTFNFSGIPAEIAVVPGTPLVQQSGNVYDLIGPGAHRLYAEALDADNNVIAGIGGPSYTVAESGNLSATVTQPPSGSPRFAVTPPATLADPSTLGTLTVTAAYGTGQTDGCVVTGAVCSSAVTLDMQSLLAVANGRSVSLFAAEKGLGPISTITSNLGNGATDVEFDGQGNLYAAETEKQINEYTLGSTIPSRVMSIPLGDLITKIALDPAGNLFAVDVSANKVYVYAPGATSPSHTISIANSAGYPYNIVVDASDDFWIEYVQFDSGSAVEPGGNVGFFARGTSTPVMLSGLVAPVGIALDQTNKTLYVSDQTQYTPAHPYGCVDSSYCMLYAYAFGNWSSPVTVSNTAYAGDIQVIDETIHPGGATLVLKAVFQDDADGSKFAMYRLNFSFPVTPDAWDAGLGQGTTQALAVDQLGNMFASAAFANGVYGYLYNNFEAGGTGQTITPFVTMTSGLSFPQALAIVP